MRVYLKISAGQRAQTGIFTFFKMMRLQPVPSGEKLKLVAFLFTLVSGFISYFHNMIYSCASVLRAYYEQSLKIEKQGADKIIKEELWVYSSGQLLHL